MHNRRMNNETPKNLRGTLIKLVKYLGGFKKYIIISFILASLGAILSIIGPNKLSDLADLISDGLIINQENLKDITSKIQTNFNEEELINTSNKILDINFNEDLIKEINYNDSISNEEKKEFNKFITQINNIDKKDIISNLNNLSNNIKSIIFKDSIYNNVSISSNDKKKFIDV